MNYWAVVFTQPVAEGIAERSLKRQGFECYLPKLQYRVAGRWKVTCLFPRYIFVWVEHQWRCVLGTRGVSKVLLDGAVPAKLPVNFVEELRKKENSKGCIRLPRDKFRKGDVVEIKNGIFKGMHGLYEGASKLDREIILLKVLGKVELASSDLF